MAGSYPSETPLHGSAFSGNTQNAELLLAKGADINAANQYGFTPLRRAMAELLIKKGADLAATDSGGLTLLHVIAQTDHIALAELLISGGTEINAKDINYGFTPLDYAQGGEPTMIELLKRHGGICTIC